MTQQDQSVTYPDIEVQLTGEDGNAFNIIGRVQHAIRKAHGGPAAEAWISKAYECPSYEALLILCQQTVIVL